MTLRCNVYAGPPGDPKSRFARICDRAEMIGPVLGNARRTYMRGAGYFVTIKSIDRRADQVVFMNVWGPIQEQASARRSR
eukprot:1397471-Pyramimonas_sp.AAC.1